MPRLWKSILLVSAVSAMASGCGDGADGGADTNTGASTSTEVETDTVTASGSDTQEETDTATASGSDTQVETDTATESATESATDTEVDSDTDSDSAPSSNEEFNDILDELGLNTGELGERTDVDGSALPDGWHPLRTRFATFSPRKEIYLVEGDAAGNQSEHLYNDALGDAATEVEAYAELAFKAEPDASWQTLLFKNAIGADVDGDGVEEVFVVFYVPASTTLKYLILDPNDAKDAVRGDIDIEASSEGLWDALNPSLAAGDLDGDGAIEIAVGFGELYVLDGDISTGSPEIYQRSYEANEVFVAMGDVDADAPDELVVSYTKSVTNGMLDIFNSLAEIESAVAEDPLVEIELRIADGTSNTDPSPIIQDFAETRVGIGDVDGDHIGDIALFGNRVAPSGNAWFVFLLKYNPSNGSYSFEKKLTYEYDYANNPPYSFAMLDMDGDSIDEVFAYRTVFKWNREDNQFDAVTSQGTVAGGSYRAVAANIDADPREELLLSYVGGVRIYEKNLADTWVERSGTSFANINHIPTVAVADVDEDSPIVRYDGVHELRFTAPNIVTVIGAPPYHEETGQAEGTTATCGVSNGDTISDSQSVGFSAGFSIGYESEFSLFGLSVGASAKTTFESAFDFYASRATTVTTYHSRTTDDGMDKVVFTTIPFDIYYYTIVASPNPDDVGQLVTINMPRQAKENGTSIEYYNAHNGDNFDIDVGILQHTAGVVSSYPNAAQKDEILDAASLLKNADSSFYRLESPEAKSVEQSGSQTMGISIEEVDESGTDMSFATTFEFEAKAGGVTAGGSVGFQYGYSYSVASSKETFYEGTIAGLDADYYPDYAYDVGLFVYPFAYGGQTFMVMNWWTEPW